MTTLPEWYLVAAITLHATAILVGLTLPWRIQRAISSGAWDGAVGELLARVIVRPILSFVKKGKP